ncbi:MAG: hypothetical protein ACRBG0_26625 [Lewinella sp.]|uniref:hypothetical protein n=1 Tax=Lewinella sp. TaxID=2004506 RepID=UPI003D6B01A0
MLQRSLSRFEKQSLLGGLSYFNNNNLLLGIISFGFFFVVSIISTPCKLILREKLGERVIGLSSFAIFLLWYAFVTSIILILIGQYGESSFLMQWSKMSFFGAASFSWKTFFFNVFLVLINPIFAFAILFLAEGINHFARCIKMIRDKKISYSYFRGDSRYFKKWIGKKLWGHAIDGTTHKLLIEPFMVFKYSSIILLLSIVTMRMQPSSNSYEAITLIFNSISIGSFSISIIFLLGAIALFAEEILILKHQRDALLDMIDSEYDLKQVLDSKELVSVDFSDSTTLDLINQKSEI